MKKALKSFVIVVIFNLIFISNVLATTTFNVSSTNAKIGEEVVVDVSIKDNTGFVGYQMTLDYDISKLEFISSSNGDLVNSKIAVLDNDKSKGIVKQAFVNQNCIKEDGSLMKVTFKVKDNINIENIPITLKVKKIINDLGDGNIKDVEHTIINGNIILDSNKNDNTYTTTNEMIDVIKNDNGKVSIKMKDENLNSKVKYRSTDETKATVDSEGNITSLSPGKVEIQALIDDEVIDMVVLDIPVEENTNVQSTDNSIEVETNSKNLVKKYIVIFSIILVILVLVTIITIIYFNKRKIKRSK